MLARTLNSLNAAMAGIALRGEVIVTDNNSTDATADIARTHGAAVVFEPINQISRARNTGARQASGRYLIFVDADTRVEPALLQQAIDNLASGQCCGGGALVDFDTPLTRAARFGLESWNRLSARMRLAAGCFVYCLQEDFTACGGFSEKVYASEEIWLSRCLKRRGKNFGRDFRIISSPRAVSSGRKLVWYNIWQQLVLLIVLTVFPFAVRYKLLCGFWYQRPRS